ncbi:hemagglutinin repeat-containing protein [Dryocola sp. BD626]|uniref:hemagglutinin repeat-containing protein n=1 Tax=Dryocola sp. BD626 TaxID=3133273 RepID=UPI003F509AD0
MDNRQQPVRFAQRQLSYLICLLIAGQPVLPAFAATTPAGSATQMDKAANGVPVVNIATPNGAGISHNQFKDYNVGREGIILNNATGQLNQTQLGGLIQNNPNLKAGGEARGIINEVTGGNRSQLQGYTEVAGKAANVMVANPYGITCNGCGFINTPNATLTTGKPAFDAQGNLRSLDVTKGTITVEGQGLNAGQSDALSIISRATEINADIHAKDLKVVTGANRVTASGGVTAIAGEGPAPQVAVDTGALGGMYANRIRLISSEKGVGVNLGNLNARQGDITLDANGKLSVKNSVANGNLTASGQDLALTGAHKAEGNIILVGQNALTVDGGQVSAGKELSAQAEKLLNNSALTAQGNATLRATRLTNNGELQSGRDLSITAAQAQLAGTQLAVGRLAVKADDLTHGGKSNAAAISLSADSLNNDGMLVAPELTIAGKKLTNSGLLQGNRALNISSAWLDNLSGGNIYSEQNLRLEIPTIDNAGLIATDGDLLFSGSSLVNSGELNGVNLTFAAASLVNQQGGLLLGKKSVGFNGQTLDNAGQIVADRLTLNADSFINKGNLQGDKALSLAAKNADNQGNMLSGGELNIRADTLNNAGLAQGKALSLTAGEWTNTGNALSEQNATLRVGDSLTNSGKILGQQGVNLSAASLNNQGFLAGAAVTFHGDLVNGGLIQGSHSLELYTPTFSNLKTGQIISGGAFDLTAARSNNAGLLQANDAFTLAGERFANQGNVFADSLVFNLQSELNNGGVLAADKLSARAGSVTNSGVMQGTDGVSIESQRFDNLIDGRLLSGGELALSAKQLSTNGTVQGVQTAIMADNWQNGGSLLGLDSLTAEVSGGLTNTGDILSEGNTHIGAQTLDNSGSLLSEGDMRLAGNTLRNGGAIQGQNLTLSQAKITNAGTAIGLQSLTLGAQQTLAGRLLMAAPLLELANGGQMLTGGTLTVNGGNIINTGTWQGQRVLLSARQLHNEGAIQSADALTLTLSDSFTSGERSKITANGSAAIQALSLTNGGQWLAKNLSLKGGSLNNAGEISGVEGLTLALNGAFTQQQDKTLLSGGRLTLSAASIDNGGRIQASELDVTSGALTNSGRLQGDNALILNLNGALNNGGTGSILSQKTLNITTPELLNYGLIQGGGSTRVNAASSARNDGRLISGADFTLDTASLVNSGWIQANKLVLNASAAVNNGTWLAERQATLTGNTLTNGGTVQGINLAVNYRQLANGGTLMGRETLSISADRVNHQASGKLFSGGNLLLNSTGFDAIGQVVALGNLTLNLTNAFTGKNVLAAGDTLSITSGGAITNQSVMQGQAINLNAGGALANKGQIATGAGAGTLSGSSIELNAEGTLQAGGDVTINSRGNILVNGFTGSAGNLTLNAVGSLINTALLYAGNNMYLLADSIKNNRGDILAGNSLWLQRDMAGNANAEVVNTSGTIETQRGDITVNTGHLLNERAGLSASVSEETDLTSTYSWLTSIDADVPLSYLDSINYDYGYYRAATGCANSCAGAYWSRPAPYRNSPGLEFAISRSQVTVNSDGSPAARISSGRDVLLSSDVLENNASHILATNNAFLSGNTLINQSWFESTETRYLTYLYGSDKYATESSITSQNGTGGSNSIYFVTTGQVRKESSDGGIYRSVIQAGGNISANFTNDISNTSTTANTGGISPTISAPTLSPLSRQSIGDITQKQSLSGADSLAVNSPEWNDRLQEALQQITGNPADLQAGEGTALRDTTAQGASIQDGAGRQAHGVDTSAYPIPAGQNGYFITSTDPNSPYLITTNPKLNGLGALDQSLFGDLYALMGITPGAAPRETNTNFTDENSFIGSSYFLERLNLHPEYDYRFLGDAAFDTRYVSNYVLNQTGSRYINGLGSDLAQMQYLMDNAANAQQPLGLTFGIALTGAQIAALDQSILWWEAATVNGQTVMIPKVYLSPKDVTVNGGSVISGNNVQLAGGNITNGGSTITARNDLVLDGQNSISNLNAGLINAGGSLQLGALGDINNIGSQISGKTVQLESFGNINNITQTELWQAAGGAGRAGQAVSFTDTLSGPVAGISAQDSLSLSAGENINITGANVSAGGNLLMNAWGDIAIASNQITDSYSQSGFRGREAFSNESVTHSGSTISAGGSIGMQAGNDLTVQASQVNAGKNTTLIAGNDLNLNAADTRESASRGKSESHSTDVARTTLSSGGDMTLAAGNDINSRAAGMAAEGNVAMQAGRDVNLLAEETTEGDSYRAKRKVEINESVRQQGTEIASGGDTTIVAGRDVLSQAARITASGDIGIAAGNDISLSTATESDYRFKEETKTKKGFMKKTTTHTIEEDSAIREAGTLLSGDNVALAAGNNLLVEGSAVVGDGDVALNAGNNIDIFAATNTDSTYRFKEKKKSGMFSGGAIGVTIGTSKSRYEMNDDGTTQSQSFSTVGSTGGDVSINAGKQVHIGGADVVAGKDLSIRGDSVSIEPGRDQRTHDESFEQKTSGLTLALSGAAGAAVNSAVSAAQAASSESDDRLAALKGTQAAMSGYQASQALQLDAANGGDPANSNTIGISASIGSQSSESRSHSEQNTAAGSTLTAGDNVAITATGGDITAIGSQIKAGQDVVLNAADDINLISSQNSQLLEGDNSSSGGSLGVGVGVGSGGMGISISASGNSTKGNESGNGTTHNETTLDAGRQVTLTSGDDTTLAGAQVSGNKVVADVGGDLTISSLQDSDRYDSKQTGVSGGGSFTFGTMTGSGGVSFSRDRMRSEYDSVIEQSGIFAGDGGFDITVGNHTQLDGGVIASTAGAEKNGLDTGTLGWNDIHNRAEYDVSHSGASISSGGNIADQFMGNMATNMLAGLGGSGDAEGTTKAAISDGGITLRDKENQQQDIASLSRDVENANGSISPIFDKEKEQKRLETAQTIGELGSQAMDIARTEGQIRSINAGKAELAAKNIKEPEKGASEQEWADYNTALKETASYKETQRKWGTGSDIQRGLQAATGVLQGLAGGDIAAAIAGGAAPYLAQQIKKQVGEENRAANAVAHAILGGVVAELQGRSAGAGAAGAATGELIAQQLYPGVKREDLTEEQKQNISALSTMAAGLAGGLAGGDTAGAIAGAQAGKNAVENNALSRDEEKKLGLRPVKPISINPLMESIGVLDSDGEVELPKGGAKGGKSKDTQIWTETKKDKPVPNAYGHWNKHKSEFPEYLNAKQYVDATHNFVTTPPVGTLTKTRPNGDTLYYNPATNVFASKDINGVPRTMFKPQKGLEYWNKQ